MLLKRDALGGLRVQRGRVNEAGFEQVVHGEGQHAALPRGGADKGGHAGRAGLFGDVFADDAGPVAYTPLSPPTILLLRSSQVVGIRSLTYY